MKRSILLALFCLFAAAAAAWMPLQPRLMAQQGASAPVSKEALEHARRTVKMLDEIYKKTVVLITEKYVQAEDDFAAGSAAVLLFKQISEGGTHQVRLLDATGKPYEKNNVARDDFEKEGIKELKQGASEYERVVQQDGKNVLRVITPIPVVMERCVMCHPHYKNAKPGEPIGAISYSIPIQ